MTRPRITYSINFTLSKIMAFLVLAIGSVYSFYFKDAGVLIATFSAASAIIALKTYVSSREKVKRYEQNYPDPYGEAPEKLPDDI